MMNSVMKNTIEAHILIDHPMAIAKKEVIQMEHLKLIL